MIRCKTCSAGAPAPPWSFLLPPFPRLYLCRLTATDRAKKSEPGICLIFPFYRLLPPLPPPHSCSPTPLPPFPRLLGETKLLSSECCRPSPRLRLRISCILGPASTTRCYYCSCENFCCLSLAIRGGRLFAGLLLFGKLLCPCCCRFLSVSATHD